MVASKPVADAVAFNFMAAKSMVLVSNPSIFTKADTLKAVLRV